MPDGDHSATRRTEGWSHPLGWTCIRRLSTGAEVLSTILDPTVRCDPQRGKAHEEAAARTRRIDCDRIVPVLDIRRTGTDRLVFDAERVAGEPLASMLENGPMQPVLASSILVQIAYALSIAHASQLLHGALSPASVLVERLADDLAVARVTDFGIGALCWDDHERNPESAPISPERVLGLDQSPAEDAYLFGCLAYAMLTGHPLFGTGGVEEIRRRHAIEDPPPMPDAAGVPDALRDFVDRCLAKEPEDRFATGTLLLMALRKALEACEIATPYDAIGLPDYREPSVTPPSAIPPTPPRRATEPKPPAVTSSPEPEVVAVRRLPTPPPPPAGRSTSSVELQPTVPIELTAPGPASPSTSEPTVAARRGRGAVLWACVGSAALVGLGVLWVAMQPSELEAGELSIAGLQAERDEPAASEPRVNAADHVEAEVEDSDPPVTVTDVEVAPEPDELPSPESMADDAQPSEKVGEAADGAAGSQRETQAAGKRTANPREEGPTNTVDDAGISDLLRQAKQAQAAGNAKQAGALYEQVLRHRPRSLTALEGLSNLAFNRGDHQGAIGYLSRAVKVAPRNADLRIRLGDAHFKLGQYAKARTHFEQANKLGHPSAARRLARVTEAQGS